MTSTVELILTAARAAAVNQSGKPCRFTLKDVKRELTTLTGGRIYDLQKSGKNREASGALISSTLRNHPDEYTAVMRRNRISCFEPYTEDCSIWI